MAQVCGDSSFDYLWERQHDVAFGVLRVRKPFTPRVLSAQDAEPGAAPVSPAVVESEAVAGLQPAQVSPVAAIGEFQI